VRFFQSKEKKRKRGKAGGEFKYPLRGGAGASAKIFNFLTGLPMEKRLWRDEMRLDKMWRDSRAGTVWLVWFRTVPFYFV